MIRNRQKSIASQRVRTFMCVLFGLFLFLYFYFLQSPLLGLTQLHMSEGKTTFHHLISALMLTVILVVVQRLVSKWVHFSDRLYFMSFVPSVVLAVLTTAFVPQTNGSVLVFAAVAMFVFVLAAFSAVKSKNVAACGNLSYAELLVRHSLGMILIFMSLGLFSNSKDITSYEIRAAYLIQHQEYKQALKIGKKSLVVSPRLSGLRAFAMAHTSKGLGGRFFHYPVSETGAEQLLFPPADSLAQMLHPDSLYANLGCWRSERESAVDFLARAARGDTAHLWVKDYWMTGLLLEKDLEEFSKVLSKYYAVTDSAGLPQHYQEALAVYWAEGGAGLAFVGDSVIRKSYGEFLDYGKNFQDSLERKNQLRREYGDTYWWFYHYQR